MVRDSTVQTNMARIKINMAKTNTVKIHLDKISLAHIRRTLTPILVKGQTVNGDKTLNVVKALLSRGNRQMGKGLIQITDSTQTNPTTLAMPGHMLMVSQAPMATMVLMAITALTVSRGLILTSILTLMPHHQAQVKALKAIMHLMLIRKNHHKPKLC